MRKIVAIPFLCACTTLAAAQRSFTFAYALTVKDVPAGAHLVDIWLRVPHDDAFQSNTNVRVETPYSYEIATGASEAAKNPARREYFFGAQLVPRQQGAALNYFVYPYVEVDGGEYTTVETTYSYTDVPI
jgi:hypothetical protein